MTIFLWVFFVASAIVVVVLIIVRAVLGVYIDALEAMDDDAPPDRWVASVIVGLEDAGLVARLPRTGVTERLEGGHRE